MKRFSLLAILAVLALLVCCILPTHAEAATSGDYTYSVSGRKATITDCSTSISGDVTIPSTLGGYPVTSIGEQAFSDCRSLTRITIPNSVTSIGTRAFYNCRSLTRITIPDSVTSIGVAAFSECSVLTRITIPNSVTSIGSWAFSYCISLRSITIPDSVTSIGDYAFCDCSSLRSITIPDSVTSIGESTFSGCSGLTSITIPDSVTSIGSRAFSVCSSLTSITIPDSVTSIGEQAFSYCSSLTSITIPNSVTSIGSWAFSSCSSLTSITIPDSVTSIGDYAFSYCSSLTSITIPDSVTTIGDYAFCDCSSLNHVAYTGTENQWNSISIGGSNSPLTNATRHYETALQTTEDCVVINVHCPVCQKTVTSIAKPNGFHAFSAATCTAPKTCTVCGVTEGTALGHSGDIWFELVAPTCVADGMKARICAVCNETEVVGITALGHKNNAVVTAPTCTEQGYTTNTCTVCGAVTVTDYVEPAGHSYKGVVTAPTCAEKGYTTHTCEVCGNEKITDYVEATGHSYGAWVQTKAPTCTEAGMEARICNICGVTETRELPASHRYRSVVTAPGCTEKGYTTHTCEVCGDVTVTDYVEPAGHSYKAVVTAPTCTEKGYTTHTCTVCGDVTVTDYVAAKGHSWSAWITTVKPTCSMAGVQVRFCNCGIRETEVLPKLPHSMEDDVCTVCGYKTVDLKIASVTLRPEAAGLYFTGSFEIAENVSVVRQGIVVSVYSSMPVADGSDPNSLWSAGTTSVMVKNILKANLKDTSNQNRAAMPIYARAYVELADGTYVYSNVSAVNLQEVVEAADGQWNTLDAIQKEAFLAMYKKFQAILQAWSIPNVKKV